jgi:ketosteroid isomerase-like protein
MERRKRSMIKRERMRNRKAKWTFGMLVGSQTFSLFLAGCSSPQPPGNNADREIVERTIHSSISWALTKDKALLDRCLTQDGDLLIYSPFGVEPNIGTAHIETAWRESWGTEDFKAIRFEMKDLRISFSQSGDVAWYAAVIDDEGEWKGEPVGWIDTRWTGVLEKRDGRWVIVQQHFSFAADTGQ